jgi:predicted nuclease of predicted toxin-antitoxin system
VRLIADENVPGEAVAAMRQAGHDVTWIRTDAPGSSDADILDRAQREDRIVVTFDRDFGELAFRSGLPARSGVILFRLPVPKPAQAAALIVATLASRDDWAGHFSVVEPGRIRMRLLPPIAPDA